MRVVFVHGGCVRDGEWWWHRVADLLDHSDPRDGHRGTPSSAPLLPSCGETGRTPGAAGPSLADDVTAVRQHLEVSDEPTVVVGHSYGGVVATEAADGLPQVVHLLYVTSFLPDVGESLADLTGGGQSPALDVRPDGTVGVRAETAAETFMQDCDDEVVKEGLARLVRQSTSATLHPAGAAAWRKVPSTYLVCGRDNGTSLELQRGQAARAGRTVELPTGHHPFLSQPRAVADLILDLVPPRS